MTTLKDYLNDFALDVIHNVVELKDPKTGTTEYDKDGLEELETEFIKNINHDLMGGE